MIGSEVTNDPLFGILGPLQVRGDLKTGSPVRRAILTAFLLLGGQSMGIPELVELLWESPPTSATANIRSHLTRLRRELDEVSPGLAGRVQTYRGAQTSYALRVAPEEVDLFRFTAAARHGRTLLLRGDTTEAVTVLEDAIALWRGPFGQHLPSTRWFETHAAGLNTVRINTYQDLFTACIIAGRTDMLSYQIETVIAEAPYRQRLWELLAAVHCIDGDAAGALDVIGRCQTLFSDDLGLATPPGVEAMRSAALNWNSLEALRLVAEGARSDQRSPCCTTDAPPDRR